MHARIGWQNLRTTEFLEDGKYLLITGTDFVDGKIDFTRCYYVKQERYNQDRNIQIKNGCILITKDGTLGKVAYVDGLNKPATLNAGIFNVEIRDEKKVDRLYLYQYIKAPFLLEYVNQMATGGTIKHLNQNILVDFMVSMPQSMEQKKIGELFQILDHLITLHQSKSFGHILKTIASCTLYWEQRKLEDYLEVSEEKNLSNEYTKENVLSVSGDVGIVNQIEFQGRSFAGILVNNYGVVKTGYVVYTKSPLKNNPYGIIKANKGINGIVSTLYAIYKPKLNVNSNFIQIYFEQNARMNNYMQPLVNKGAKNDMKISSENALKGNVTFPIRKEQDTIVDFFFKIDHLITLHQLEPYKLIFKAIAYRIIDYAKSKPLSSIK